MGHSLEAIKWGYIVTRLPIVGFWGIYTTSLRSRIGMMVALKV
jgi:hypothetical protein